MAQHDFRDPVGVLARLLESRNFMLLQFGVGAPDDNQSVRKDRQIQKGVGFLIEVVLRTELLGFDGSSVFTNSKLSLGPRNNIALPEQVRGAGAGGAGAVFRQRQL